MRYVAEQFRVEVFLRFSMLTIVDELNVTDTLVQTSRLYPAIVGKLVRATALPSPYPRVDGLFREDDAWKKIIAATGASGRLSSAHTAVALIVYGEDRAAWFWMDHPDKGNQPNPSILSYVSLSSRKSYLRDNASSVMDTESPPDPTQPSTRTLIAPWQDPEMLGQAILTFFRAAKPPLVKGVDSVFDMPKAKGRVKLHRTALEGNSDDLPKSNRSGRDFDPVDSYRATPLMLAAGHGHSEVVERLLVLGASVAARDSRSRTPLHYAVQTNDAENAEHLFEAGSDIEARDEMGRTPLHTAVDHGHIEVVRLLLARGGDPNIHDEEYSCTPLHLAARGNHSSIVPILVQYGARLEESNEAGRTPLHVASAYGSIDTVRSLIEAEANVNQRDDSQETPLHRACLFQHADVIEELIAGGADLNAADVAGDTPLHVSASMNREVAAQLLLHHGAEIEPRDFEGLTPLDVSLINCHMSPQGCEEHNAEVADVLFNNGATIVPSRLPVQDRHALWPHLTPKSVLMSSGNLDDQELFIKADGRVVRETSSGEVDLPHSVAKELKSNPQIVDNLPRESPVIRMGFTILHDAIKKNMIVLAERLLDSGVSVTPATWLTPPLHFASGLGNIEAVQLLLNNGADLEMARDSSNHLSREFVEKLGRHVHAGWTPLDEAIEKKQVAMVQFLLSEGAEPPDIVESVVDAEMRSSPLLRSSMDVSGTYFSHPLRGGIYEDQDKYDAIVDLFERHGSPIVGPEQLKYVQEAREKESRSEARQRTRASRKQADAN